jgi:hypothetical protein
MKDNEERPVDGEAAGSPARGSGEQFVIYEHGWLARFGPTTSLAERRVYDALAVRFNPRQHGIVWMRHQTIAGMTGYSRRQTVGDALRGLQAKGLIDVIDWPVDVGPRTVGGGKDAGKHDVFVLLHADDRGHHRAERVRPTIAEVRDALAKVEKLQPVLARLLMAGRPFSHITQATLHHYPRHRDLPPVPDHPSLPASEHLSDDVLVALNAGRLVCGIAWSWASKAMYDELQLKYAHVTIQPPRDLFQVPPETPAEEVLPMRRFSNRDPFESVVTEVEPHYRTVLEETSQHVDLPLWRPGQNAGTITAPCVERMSEKLDVLPAFIISAAREIAVRGGDVVLVCDLAEGFTGKLYDELHFRDPPTCVAPEVAALAMLAGDELTNEHLRDFEQILPRIRAAQQELIETWVEAVVRAPRWPEDIEDTELADHASRMFGDWAESYHYDGAPPVLAIDTFTIERTLLQRLAAARSAKPESSPISLTA